MRGVTNLIFALVLASVVQFSLVLFITLPGQLATHHGLVTILSMLAVALMFAPLGMGLAALPLPVSLLLWGTIYFSVLFRDRALIFSINGSFWIVVAEIIVLTAMIVLSHQLARRLAKIGEILGNVVLGDGEPEQSYAQETALDIRRELRRSRHYNRPLGMIILDYDLPQSQELYDKVTFQVQASLVDRYVRAQLVTLLERELRLMDLVVDKHDEKRIVIMCPELDIEEVDSLVRHLQATIKEQLNVNVQGAGATFPGEGVTYDSLVLSASTKLKQRDSAPPAGSSPLTPETTG